MKSSDPTAAREAELSVVEVDPLRVELPHLVLHDPTPVVVVVHLHENLPDPQHHVKLERWEVGEHEVEITHRR